ncbi:MAG: hypothetical protein U9N34_10065 [Candidatus Cloacimonadota bacterium]|nr:hypothetical protein [Candidatus Cloacimonadota bacterium]
MKKYTLVLLVLVVGIMMFIASCDNRTSEIPEYEITSVTASPDVIYADNSADVFSTISVLVKDDGEPAADVTVKLSSNIGSVPGTVITNASGVATAEFIDNGIVGYASIEAKVGDASNEVVVNVKESPDFLITNIQSSADTIYADNGITKSDIEITVRDQENFAVGNETVMFRCTNEDTGESFGNIIPNCKTDSTGIATTTFWDQGTVGNAKIEAFVGSSEGSINVNVIEEPDYLTPEIEAIGSIEVGTVVNVMVRFNYDNVEQSQVSDGTVVRLEVLGCDGFFQNNSSGGQEGNSLGNIVNLETSNGIVTTSLNVGTRAIANAAINAKIGTMISTESFDIKAGLPTTLTYEEFDENNDLSFVLQDAFNNPVRDRTITFETTLGFLDPPSDDTNDVGYAFTHFTAGIQAGTAEITAQYTGPIGDDGSGGSGGSGGAEEQGLQATAMIPVNAGVVNSMMFANNNQIIIDVAGTGGVESYEATVNLFDNNGNQIDTEDEIEVFFVLETAPEGAKIIVEGEEYFQGQEVGINSTYGHASVSVNSGFTSGTIKLTARIAETDDHSEIIASKTNIAIASGPAAQVQFAIGDNNSGEELGSGVWQVEVAATVNDAYNNPVSDGTVVFLSIPIEDENGNDCQPEEDEMDGDEFDDMMSSVSIDPVAFVGNESADGDSIKGVAFSSVTYDGRYSMKDVMFKVEIAIGNTDVLTSTPIVKLPFHSLNMDIAPTPEYVSWPGGSSDNSLKSTLIRVHITDGQATPINEVPIVFHGTLGMALCANTNDGDGDVFTELTGIQPITGNSTGYQLLDLDYNYPGIAQEGVIFKEWAFLKYECPAPPPPPGSTSATITAQVLGDNTTNTVTIILFRYFD